MRTTKPFLYEGTQYTLSVERAGRTWLGRWTDDTTGATGLVSRPCSTAAAALKAARLGAMMTHGLRHPREAE